MVAVSLKLLADEAIGVALDYVETERPNTLLTSANATPAGPSD